MLLERLRLQLASAGSLPPDVAQTQVDFLLARIAALTEALRGAGGDDTTRLATRVLLSDLALVAAQFRGRANAVGASLTGALDGIRVVMEDLAGDAGS